MVENMPLHTITLNRKQLRSHTHHACRSLHYLQVRKTKSKSLSH